MSEQNMIAKTNEKKPLDNQKIRLYYEYIQYILGWFLNLLEVIR